MNLHSNFPVKDSSSDFPKCLFCQIALGALRSFTVLEETNTSEREGNLKKYHIRMETFLLQRGRGYQCEHGLYCCGLHMSQWRRLSMVWECFTVRRFIGYDVFLKWVNFYVTRTKTRDGKHRTSKYRQDKFVRFVYSSFQVY